MKYYFFIIPLFLFSTHEVNIFADTKISKYQYIQPVSVEKMPLKQVVSVDIDSDGVLNEHDKCPNTIKNTLVSSDGCKVGTVALLGENDKDHNAIVIKNKRGEVLIDKPYQYVTIVSKYNLPTLPKDMSKEQVNSLFGEIVSINSSKPIRFVLYFDETELMQQSKEKIVEVIKCISERENAFIKIIGHTDTTGDFIENDKLGEIRAGVVTKIIQSSNVLHKKISVDSYGEYNLAIKTEDEVFEPLNRRVEILIQ